MYYDVCIHRRGEKVYRRELIRESFRRNGKACTPTAGKAGGNRRGANHAEHTRMGVRSGRTARKARKAQRNKGTGHKLRAKHSAQRNKGTGHKLRQSFTGKNAEHKPLEVQSDGTAETPRTQRTNVFAYG